MIKYFLNYSGRKVYLDIFKSLSVSKIAKPLLLFGDQRLDDNFETLYPGKVIHDKTFFKNFHKLNDYVCESSDLYKFFSSKNYLKFKDQIFKMMDRVDHLGTWSRLNRESYLNKLIIFWFNKIKKLNPDVLIFCDTPHTHETYSLYIVAKYLGKKICIINQWAGVAPCVFGEIIIKKKYRLVFKKNKYTSDVLLKNHIKNYFDNLVIFSNKTNYQPFYMKKLFRNNLLLGSLLILFENKIMRKGQGLAIDRIIFRALIFIFNSLFRLMNNFIYLILDFLILKFFRNEFITSFKLSILMQKIIINKKIRFLKVNYDKNVDINSTSDLKLNKNKFVFYAMHYEHEVSTNPLGENFYDQYLTILAIRKWIPKNIKLFVKEHPSQFFSNHAKGYMGRSQYFYDALKKISGVYLVSNKLNSLVIIKNSLLVASTTGIVLVEASILGKKAIYFGKPWFKGLPNTFKWTEKINYSNIITRKTDRKKKILSFLLKKYDKFCFPAMLNPSTMNLYPIANNKAYKMNDFSAMYDLIKILIKNNPNIQKKN